MKAQEALKLIEDLLEKTNRKPLESKERSIILGTWQGLSYKQIAIELEYSNGYIASEAAPKVWALISDSLFDLVGTAQVVGKKNLKAVIERNEALIKSKLELLKKKSSTVLKFQVSNSSGTSLINSQIKELEVPEGPLPLGSNLYIQRQEIEGDCYNEVLRSGGLIRIKAPNQTGKTSLIIRILDFCEKKEFKIAYFNFQDDADSSCFSDFEEFLKWFCITISETLGLPEETEKYWKGGRGGQKIKCRKYFEDYLLKNIKQPLVLAIDEIDCIFGEGVATDFLALLRSWHELSKRGQNVDLWRKLRLVLSYSTEAYSTLNINQSPFNIGLPVELSDFQCERVLELAKRYGLKYNNSEMEKLISIIGTHPYLVQIAFYNLAKQKITFSELLKKAHTEEGIYGFHLRRHLNNLQRQPELFLALKSVLHTSKPTLLDSLERFKLHSMGIVNLRGNKVEIRCQLYQKYFQEILA